MLLIIFIIELAVGIAACVFKSDLDMMLQKSLQNSIERSSMDDIMAWDNVQKRLMCCGINRASDWEDFSRNHTIRSSCCRPEFIDGTKDCKNNLSLFQHRYYQVKDVVITNFYSILTCHTIGWLSTKTQSKN